MPRPTPPSPPHLPPSNAPHRASARRLRAPASRRPERYEVAHRPRRVIQSHAGDPLRDERNAPRQPAGKPAPDEAPDRPRRTSLWKRVRRIGFGPWEWIGLGASAVACLFLLRGITGAQSEQRRLRAQVHAKQTLLAALNKQKHEEEKKLAYLRSEKGREQILAERGYLKPGDRILVFPADKETKNSAE